MANALKSKICWNCDGSLGLEEERCPFCGTPQDQIENQERGERVVALPLDPLQEALKKVIDKEVVKINFLDRLNEKELLLITLVSTMLGATLFLFTLLLFLFSKDGKLTIVWDASFWPLFALTSSLLLYLSYKVQKKL